MPTAAALPSRVRSSATEAGADSSSMGHPRGKKFLQAKRKSSGNNTPNNKNNYCPHDENGIRKLNFFKKGILPSPCKNKGNGKTLGETNLSPSKDLGNYGPRESGFDSKGFGLFGGRKNRKPDGKPGSDLVMEKVTILKRGENIESVVAGRVSNEEEIGRGKILASVENDHGGSGVLLGNKVTVNCVGDGREGVPVSVDNKVLKQHPHRVWGSAEKGQIKKARASVTRVSQVCPVGSSGSISDSGVDCVGEKPHGMMENDLVTRIGPEPGEVSKEVFGIARSVSIASGSSEFGSDDGDSAVKLGEGGSGTERSSLTSVGSPPSSCKDMMFDSMSDLSHELIVASGQAWAGPTYANSPPPCWLPLPRFFMRHKTGPNNAEEHNDLIKGGGNNTAASGSVIQESKTDFSMPIGLRNVNMNNGGVDAFATRNLRRLLHLE